MTNPEELLAKIQTLKTAATTFGTLLQDAKTRDAIIESQLTALGQKLAELADGIEWAEIGEAITRAAEAAESAVETLEGALNAAGVEYE